MADQGSLPSRFAAYRWLSKICEEFEQAWSKEPPPQVTDYLIETRELLVELLLTDMEARSGRDLLLKQTDYEGQLPGFADAISEAFQRYQRDLANASVPATVSLPDPHNTVLAPAQPQAARFSESSRGRYQIVKPHAKGGLGEVFVALDTELQRTVALKQVQAPYSHDADHLGRFVFEAEITGCLEHPGVVAVYSLGYRHDGQPYYAMRFIRGQSLSDTIREFHNEGGDLRGKELKLRGLLRRFIDVCNTIAYAHDRRVLHRDIKPGNVMLGPYGETLVVDWGLAKVLSKEELSTDPTESGLESLAGRSDSHTYGPLGTPQYMSPEQARGHRVGPATDIYSLGATLFTLLTGQNSVDSQDASETLRKVQLGQVRSPRQVDPTVPRPLDAICQKAMSFDPKDRYATSKDLAADVENWLGDEPVAAYQRDETRVEKVQRWMKKHRTWVLAGSVALVLISFLSTVTALLVSQAWHRERLAQQESDRLRIEAIQRFRESRESIDKWVTGTSHALKFFPGMQGVRKRLLQEAARDYARLAEANSHDLDLELERGRGVVRLGDVSLLLEEFENTERYYQEAISMFARMRQRGELTGLVELEELRTRAKYAALLIGRHRHTDANEQIQIVLQATGNSVPDSQRELLETRAITLVHYANSLADGGNSARAEQQIKAAVAAYASLTERHPQVPDYARGLAVTREQYAGVLAGRGDHKLAIEQLSLADQALKAMVNASKDEPDFLEALARVLVSLSIQYRMGGEPAGEEDALRGAALHYEALLRAIPDVPRYRENLALTYTDIGIMLFDMGRCADATVELQKAQEHYSDLVIEYPGEPQFEFGLAVTQGALGRALADLSGGLEESQELLSLSLRRLNDLHELYPTELEYFRNLALAENYYASCSEDPAAPQFFDVAILRLRRLREVAPEAPDYRNELAYVHREYGNWHLTHANENDAIDTYKQADKTWGELVAEFPTPEYQDVYAFFLANCPVETLRSPTRAIEVAMQAHHAAPQNPKYCNTLAAAYFRANQLDEAERLLQDAVRLRGYGNGRDLFFLAMIAFKRGQPDQARIHFDEGVKWMDENQPRNAELGRLRQEVERLLAPDPATATPLD